MRSDPEWWIGLPDLKEMSPDELVVLGQVQREIRLTARSTLSRVYPRLEEARAAYEALAREAQSWHDRLRFSEKILAKLESRIKYIPIGTSGRTKPTMQQTIDSLVKGLTPEAIANLEARMLASQKYEEDQE